MCGIAGIVSYGEAPSLTTAAAMSLSLRHRGPDEDGLVGIDDTCALASRRLSIIDLAGGHQPMWDERERHCLIFNGEIYNHASIRPRLERLGHIFKTDHSDTEVLVHGFEEWGTELFAMLDGQFAIAIWDRDRRELVLARDRAGEKPVYFGPVPGGYVFGSEIKALLAHPQLARDLDPAGIEQYLAFDYVVAPRTVLRDVRKLRAGHVAVLSRDGVSTTPYWRLAFRTRRIARQEAVERLDHELDAAVTSRMIADVPVGLFLSGGLDSSTVGFYMARQSPSVRAFTIGFEEQGYDETDHARTVASHLGLSHEVEILSERRVLDLVPQVTDILDEPMADPSVFPTYLLSAVTRPHVKVALGGDGSDELLMGYRTFQALKASAMFDVLPRVVRTTYAAGARRLPDRTHGVYGKGRRFIAGLDVAPETRLLARLGAFGLSARSVLDSSFRQRLPEHVASEPVREIEASSSGALDWGDRTIAAYFRAYLQEDILTKVDRASMAASLEVRAPFLAAALIDFLAELPSSTKMPGFARKQLLRDVMRGRIPDVIIDRPKQGFGAPLDSWFRGDLAPLATETLASDRLKSAGILDAERANQLLVEHRSRRADHGRRIWTLVQLQLWYERWVARGTSIVG